MEDRKCVRLRSPPGCCNRWFPSWGCRGWCCRSARCRWARRRTAPLWRQRWSAWGRGDAPAAWRAWKRRMQEVKRVLCRQPLCHGDVRWVLTGRSPLGRSWSHSPAAPCRPFPESARSVGCYLCLGGLVQRTHTYTHTVRTKVSFLWGPQQLSTYQGWRARWLSGRRTHRRQGRVSACCCRTPASSKCAPWPAWLALLKVSLQKTDSCVGVRIWLQPSSAPRPTRTFLQTGLQMVDNGT